MAFCLLQQMSLHIINHQSGHCDRGFHYDSIVPIYNCNGYYIILFNMISSCQIFFDKNLRRDFASSFYAFPLKIILIISGSVHHPDPVASNKCLSDFTRKNNSTT